MDVINDLRLYVDVDDNIGKKDKDIVVIDEEETDLSQKCDSSSNSVEVTEHRHSFSLDETQNAMPVPIGGGDNKSELYQFLFDGIDSDTDDDDIFAMTSSMDYTAECSAQLPVQEKNIDLAAPCGTTKIAEKQRVFVPCRPLWELLK